MILGKQWDGWTKILLGLTLDARRTIDVFGRLIRIRRAKDDGQTLEQFWNDHDTRTTVTMARTKSGHCCGKNPSVEGRCPDWIGGAFLPSRFCPKSDGFIMAQLLPAKDWHLITLALEKASESYGDRNEQKS